MHDQYIYANKLKKIMMCFWKLFGVYIAILTALIAGLNFVTGRNFLKDYIFKRAPDGTLTKKIKPLSILGIGFIIIFCLFAAYFSDDNDDNNKKQTTVDQSKRITINYNNSGLQTRNNDTLVVKNISKPENNTTKNVKIPDLKSVKVHDDENTTIHNFHRNGIMVVAVVNKKFDPDFSASIGEAMSLKSPKNTPVFYGQELDDACFLKAINGVIDCAISKNFIQTAEFLVLISGTEDFSKHIASGNLFCAKGRYSIVIIDLNKNIVSRRISFHDLKSVELSIDESKSKLEEKFISAISQFEIKLN